LNGAHCKGRIKIILAFKDGVFPRSGDRGRDNYGTRTWAVYAMITSCVGPWDGAGRTVRGQETLSMPSANVAFMSLT
jgi:hypothetical protein